MGRFFLRFVGLVVVAGFLAGCSGRSLKLDSSTIGKIQNRKLALVVAAPPKLTIMTPEKGMIGSGLLASLIVLGLSDDLAKDYSIPNPARTVGNNIQDKLARKHHMSPSSSAATADILLEVNTIHWDVVHGPLSWASYHPRVNMTVKLLDRKTRTVLSEGQCVNTKAMTKERGYDEILQNSGAVLKRDINQLAHQCAQKILAKL